MGKQSFIIGRAGHITLYDDTVSRRHACLDVEDGQLFLRDLKSRNGTYEIRDKKLVPFSSGTVTADQVFAFGECVRSVTQLLSEAGVSNDTLSATHGPLPGDDDDPLNATQIGFHVPSQPRLSATDIIAMLEKIEDHRAGGGSLADICAELGVNEARYQRWAAEYGATRDDRQKSLADLRRENAQLRTLVADLSVERQALLENLRQHGVTVSEKTARKFESVPNFSVVSNDPKS